MTTTEQPALPQWEARSRNYQYIPRLQRNYIGDPGFMQARLREALQRAHAVAEAQDGMDPVWRRNLELKLLTRDIERLADEFRHYTPGADEFLTVLQGLDPDIEWTRHCMGFAGDGDLETCIRAARTLRLTEEDASGRTAQRIWHGTPEGWDVTIYYYSAPKQ